MYTKSLEEAALRSLYDATGGASWKNNNGWITASDLDDWNGVTATSGTVVAIQLNANRLAGMYKHRLLVW
jgi:hypothetical protein